MQWETLDLEHSGAVARLTLNRPTVRNAFNDQMRRDLHDAVGWLDRQETLRVVVLAAAGASFCAGADLVEAQSDRFSVIRVLTEQYKPGLLGIYRSPKTWISAVNGAAAGIGVAFAQVCDLSIMAEDASLYLAFEGISLIPDGGISMLLERAIGRKRAYQIMVERGRIDASQCLAWGLCNRVVPASDLAAESMRWAQSLSERAPLSLRYVKSALNVHSANALDTVIEAEALYQTVCAQSDDAREGIEAFLQKRPPRWQGR